MTAAVGRAKAVSLLGLDGQLVDVEVLVVANLPAFVLVGLPDAALNEAKDRIRGAFASSRLDWPSRRITVNLGPASLRKTGSGFDLGIAMAILAALGRVDPERTADTVYLGELGLDGRVRPVRGVLPAVLAARSAGHRRVVVPSANLAEARLIGGIDAVGTGHLVQAAIAAGAELEPRDPPDEPEPRPTAPRARAAAALDLADVHGQALARDALEIAAAGGHHLLLLGPPGAGKTMLAARMPGLLPDLPEDEAVTVTAIHSVAGSLDPAGGLIRRPPFEDPHHTATAAAIVGGGSGIPRPGAASRAHGGVLFLDEAPEFPAAVLQTLRQPLETGELVLQRAGGVARYPARFQLVLAANPCPCGQGVGQGLACSCTPLARRRYAARLGGPLLDRIDLQVEVLPVRAAEAGFASGQVERPESSAAVAERVAKARAAQAARYAGETWRTNAAAPGPQLRAALSRTAGRAARDAIGTAMSRGLLTLRGADRVVKVAWTIADLAGRTEPEERDLLKALALRTRSTA